jgi:hypothetical protein
VVWVPLLIGSGSERYMMIPTFAPKERGPIILLPFGIKVLG